MSITDVHSFITLGLGFSVTNYVLKARQLERQAESLDYEILSILLYGCKFVQYALPLFYLPFCQS